MRIKKVIKRRIAFRYEYQEVNFVKEDLQKRYKT